MPDKKNSSSVVPNEVLISPAEPHSQQANNPDSPPTIDIEAATNNRDLDEITDAIVRHSQNIESEYLEIGKLLNEAKARMPHGYWLEWLKDNTDIRVGTAQRLMRIAKEFSYNSPVAHLGFTKASILLTLPESERDVIMGEDHIINGRPKNIEKMTKRELEDVVRKRKLQIAGKLKSEMPQSNPDDDKLPPSAEFKRSSNEIDFDVTIKSLESFMQSLLMSIAANDDMDKRDEITAALRCLCEDTLQCIKNTELTISDPV